MNNTDLINQGLYMTEDYCVRPITNIEIFILIGLTGLLVLFTVFAIWYSMKD